MMRRVNMWLATINYEMVQISALNFQVKHVINSGCGSGRTPFPMPWSSRIVSDGASACPKRAVVAWASRLSAMVASIRASLSRPTTRHLHHSQPQLRITSRRIHTRVKSDRTRFQEYILTHSHNGTPMLASTLV